MHCMIPGQRINNKTVFNYSKNHTIRSNQIYKNQVEMAVINNQTFEGVKGICYLSDLIHIPDHVLLDNMHR